MKQILSAVLFISIIFFSCKKESSFNRNTPPDEVAGARAFGKGKPRPPVANAGPDQTIILPANPNTVTLDGTASTDPNNDISSYLWTKISGPSSTIANANAIKTEVSNLVEGVYQFELKVTDSRSFVGKDIVQVTVLVSLPPSPPSPPSPPPCTTCKIVFVSAWDGNNEIYTSNTDGSNITRLTNDPGSDEQPVWSPDGTRIAFTSNRGGYSGLYIMNADGSNVVQRTFSGDPNGWIQGLTWSPDGTKIAYSVYTYYYDYYYQESYEDWGFYVVSATSGSPLQLDLGGAAVGQPAWSPDGTKIALTIYNDIYTMNSDGTGLTPLTFAGNDDIFYSPSWSPNGAKLAVVFSGSSSSNIPHVSVMNADGSGLTLLRPGYGNTSWSADGTILAYTSLSGSIYNVSWVAANGSTGGTIVTNGWSADWH